jgi:ATP-binding protein involved in chromosome partitioning
VSRRIRTYSETGDAGGGDILAQVEAQGARLARRLETVACIIAVGSGKGGVGKSLITANLAAAFAAAGRRVGVLDADLNGPSVAAMLGAERAPLRIGEDGVWPAASAAGCSVMSMELLLAGPDSPVRWREPAIGGFVWQSTLETGALREMLADTVWGELDYLLVDMPPGTDRMARLLTLVPRPSALVLVTTPSAASVAVVARSVAQAKESLPDRVGIVSNMEGYACAKCGAPAPLFRVGAGAALAREAAVPYWGAVPFDPELGEQTDAGRPVTAATSGDAAAEGAGAPRHASHAARALCEIAESLERFVAGTRAPAAAQEAAQ